MFGGVPNRMVPQQSVSLDGMGVRSLPGFFGGTPGVPSGAPAPGEFGGTRDIFATGPFGSSSIQSPPGGALGVDAFQPVSFGSAAASHSEPGMQADPAITTSISVVRWRDALEYRNALTQGDFAMVNRRHVRTVSNRIEGVLLNLGTFNDLLQRNYLDVMKSVNDAATGQDYEEDLSRPATLQELLNRPEQDWYTDPRFQSLVAPHTASGRMLRYLTARGIQDEWNLAGVVVNDPSAAKGLQATVQSYGAENVSNVFADTVSTMDPLWLVLRRRWDSARRDYGAFQLVPWIGRQAREQEPSLEDRQYQDLSGHQQYGPAFRVGVVVHGGARDAPREARQRALGEVHGPTRGLPEIRIAGALPGLNCSDLVLSA